MAKLISELNVDIHTNIKRDLITPTNEEILKALKGVINIPDSILSLDIKLSVDNPPIIIVTKYAEKEN